MKNFKKLAMPYAMAIFDVECENKQLSRYDFILKILSNIISEKIVINILKNPQNSDLIYQFLSGIMNDLNIELDDKMSNFLKLLISWKRIFILPNIYQEFHKIYQEFLSQINVLVISCVSLNIKQKNNLRLILAKKLNIEKKNILLNLKIDKSLLGGIIVKIGDTVIDNSVRNNLEKMRCNLQENNNEE